MFCNINAKEVKGTSLFIRFNLKQKDHSLSFSLMLNVTFLNVHMILNCNLLLKATEFC